MSLQSEFINFNDRIKLDYDVREELAEKRDILIRKLRNNDDLPKFDEFNQGSYGLYLGVEPVNDKEYDIDVGLRFDINKSDFNPLDLKNKICEVLKNHTEYGAEIKEPCVTVTYKKAGEAAYHVDLAVYAYEDSQYHYSQLFLAKGKGSDSDEAHWEKSDPTGLIEYINNAQEKGEKREQFRRIIRYLKRWKNLRFVSVGHNEPPSIGITLIVVDYFYFVPDNDLSALKNIVDKMLNLFELVGFEGERRLYRITYKMPAHLNFESDSDVFYKMTDKQMTTFKDKLEKFSRDLSDVENETDEVEQCKMLNKIFGNDFKVPDEKEVSKKQEDYIPASSSSGVVND